MPQIDQLCINAIRVLGADAIQKANSGHPGIVLGAAPMAYELFGHHMKHDPLCPDWPDRDRFILSAGHGSMLLYGLLHFFGYGLDMDEIKRFRQLGSKAAGHPEFGLTAGIEATTGPLGQGVAMAVGMAMAESHMGAIFNRRGHQVVDHYTYALVGDGCMMEGISGEACSLAGTLKLNKLIVLYDCNRISIEGDTKAFFDEDVAKRYEAYGWNVLNVADGDDIQTIGDAIEAAKKSDKPSLIIVNTKIGRYSPLEGSEKSHGAALGADNVAALRKNLDWPLDEAFAMPLPVYDHCAQLVRKGADSRETWERNFENYRYEWPDLAGLWDAYQAKGLPEGFDKEAFVSFAGAAATRGTSGECLNRLNAVLPNLFGGSADLAPSNLSLLNGVDYFSAANPGGRNVQFGVREAAMAAIINGLYLHGGLRSYCATFMVFSDYLRPGVRLSALMDLPVIYILTHDSIAVGEDGPTHEPIEHLASFRIMPNCTIFRPADGKETAAAYLYAMEQAKGPVLLALSRQNLPTYENSSLEALKGGYILDDCDGMPEIILMATGSEVELAQKTLLALREDGIKARLVSMPCLSLFDAQDAAYREKILPAACKARLAIEAGSSYGWKAYVGDAGDTLCLDTFGVSAPAADVLAHFGFTPENALAKAKALLK